MTPHNLPDFVKDGRFREDLYYRLRLIELLVPPLRDRGDNRVALAAHFLDHFRRQIGRGPVRLSPAAALSINSYGWPATYAN